MEGLSSKDDDVVGRSNLRHSIGGRAFGGHPMFSMWVFFAHSKQQPFWRDYSARLFAWRLLRFSMRGVKTCPLADNGSGSLGGVVLPSSFLVHDQDADEA